MKKDYNYYCRKFKEILIKEGYTNLIDYPYYSEKYPNNLLIKRIIDKGLEHLLIDSYITFLIGLCNNFNDDTVIDESFQKELYIRLSRLASDDISAIKELYEMSQYYFYFNYPYIQDNEETKELLKKIDRILTKRFYITRLDIYNFITRGIGAIITICFYYKLESELERIISNFIDNYERFYDSYIINKFDLEDGSYFIMLLDEYFNIRSQSQDKQSLKGVN